MAAVSSKRFKVKPLWVLNLLILSCAGLFFFQLFGPHTAIVVSKATTHITEPLGEDGLPDYEAYLVERGFEGVTTENNAAVLIWQAIWPRNLGQEYWLLMCDALGIPELPSQDASLVDVYDASVREQIAFWLAQRYVAPEGINEEYWLRHLDRKTVELLIDEATSRPWTSEDLPVLAEWVNENQKPLDLLIEASKRPCYFSPSPNHLDGSNEGLIASLLPMAQSLREVTKALNLRAMWHLGEGRPEEAWQDLRASFQFAQFATSGWTLVHQLVGIAIESMTCDRTALLLHHINTTPDLALQILRDLEALPSPPRFADIIDKGERLSLIDGTLALATGRNDALGTIGDALTSTHVDFNYILRDINRYFDRIVAATRLSTRTKRHEAFLELEKELFSRSGNVTNPSRVFRAFFSRRTRSAMIADILLSLLTPAAEAALSAQDRNETEREMIRLAAALAVYRAQHGEYPEQIAELVPKVLREMPLDLYSGEPFVYERKDDDGYLLYSVFKNAVDDGGTDLGGKIVEGEWVEEPHAIDYGECDRVIRMPVPAFKMPDPPQAKGEWSVEL